jgi:glyoxylase-like metal-dependent hydrolase (beta-lactamase superfamily II)
MAVYQVARFGPVVRIRLAPTWLGRPLMWVHAFWVDGLLIDSGCRFTVPALMAALAREGLRVEQLVHTHTHEDHVAGDAELHRRYGVVPRAHPLGVGRLWRPERPREVRLYRRLIWGLPESSPGEPLEPVVETDRYRFQVIHTPGHAPDHVVFWAEREGWLFSGDLLLSPRLNRTRSPEDPRQILASMRMVAALPIRQLFCAHAYRVYDGPTPLLAKISYWEYIQREASALRAQGYTPAQAAQRLLGRSGVPEWISGGELSKRNLVEGLLGVSSGKGVMGEDESRWSGSGPG